MKTVTITIPEDLDRRAALESRRLGISKSELIRRGLRHVMPADDAEPTAADAWTELAGFAAHDVTGDPVEVDDVVYGT